MACAHAPAKPKYRPNGCGPKARGLWGKFLNWVVPELLFHRACDCHDFAYAFGAEKEDAEEFRERADFEFLQHMLEIAERKPWYLRHLLRRAAYAYYGSVREFGQEMFATFEDAASLMANAEKMGYTSGEMLDLVSE
jgi:hypothetical protein